MCLVIESQAGCRFCVSPKRVRSHQNAVPLYLSVAQVRALRHGSPLSLVQSLPIGGASYLAHPLPQPEAPIFAASDMGIYCLNQARVLKIDHSE